MISYVDFNDTFIKGFEKWIKTKGIDKDNIVEVFAGSGNLGLDLLKLKEENVTDGHQWRGYIDETDEEWVEMAERLKPPENADQTIYRFTYSEEDIKLLIMSMPPEAEKGDDACAAYFTAKALHYFFPEAKMLFIGPPDYTDKVASMKFYSHVIELEDDAFYKQVTSKLTDPYSEATLRQFKICEDETCCCGDKTDLEKDYDTYVEDREAQSQQEIAKVLSPDDDLD